MSLQLEFVQRMVEQGVLLFGDFRLKSGGQTPYFFNLGNVSTGQGLTQLGESYARCIAGSSLKPDVLFGPAYKGISLAVTTGIGLAGLGIDVGVAFNRKEAKERGEGGLLIGASMEGKRVVVIDDVIVDGGAKIESVEMIKQAGGTVEGIVIAIDRCEYLTQDKTASEHLSEVLQTNILSVSTLHDVIEYLSGKPDQRDNLDALLVYAKQHCKGV